MENDKKLNIFSLNFVLILVGFPLFTTFVDSSVGSIIYRAVTLGISLICLLRTRHNLSTYKSIPLKIFLFLFVIFSFKVVYELSVGEYAYTYFTSSKQQVFLFLFGINWIPFISVLSSYKRIQYNKSLILMFVMLGLTLLISLKGTTAATAQHFDGRYSMNARQSTLAFGDNGAYFSLLSMALLLHYKIGRRKFIVSLLFLLGVIGGLYCAALAGSRGPFVSAFAGIFFIFLTLPKVQKSIYTIILCLVGLSGSLSLSVLDNFAPALHSRLENSIENGDTSGRDVLFEQAWKLICDNPIIGANPVVLAPKSFSGYHNVYLGLGVGVGMIGLFLFIFTVVALLFKTIKMKTESHTAFSIFIFAMFWFNASRGITGINLISNTLYVVIFALTCVILKQNNQNKYVKS